MTTVPDGLDRRFRDAAASAGLLDVAYDFTDSPVGRLLVAASERGVCRISFDPEPERELDELARTFGTRVLRSPGPVEDVVPGVEQSLGGRGRAEALVERSGEGHGESSFCRSRRTPEDAAWRAASGVEPSAAAMSV